MGETSHGPVSLSLCPCPSPRYLVFNYKAFISHHWITMVKKKTDLQKVLKRDCADSSRVRLFLMSASITRILNAQRLCK